jgi:hypothetical protein
MEEQFNYIKLDERDRYAYFLRSKRINDSVTPELKDTLDKVDNPTRIFTIYDMNELTNIDNDYQTYFADGNIAVYVNELGAPQRLFVWCTINGVSQWKEIIINDDSLSTPYYTTKEQIGLGNVDNTSDLLKPISNAVQAALNLKVDTVAGKGLSTNDFNSIAKAKVDSINIAGNGMSFLTDNGTYKTINGISIDDSAPSASTTYSSTKIVNTITSEMAKITDLAPDSLNTFKEFAAAINSDPSFSTTILTALANKVDKVDGKGLSVNDYTTIEKTKLAGIADNANNYVHPVSGVISGTYKNVTVDANGHITNGTNPTTISGFGITDAYTKTEVDNKVSGISGVSINDTDIFSTTTTLSANKITVDMSNKVNKVTGKSLSTNDYSSTDKNKVDKINIVGDGTQFLASDGTYKTVSTTGGTGANIDDNTSSATTTYSSQKINSLIDNSGSGSGNTILQKTFLNVITNEVLDVPVPNDISQNKVIIEPYKFVPGTDNVIETLKAFDNTDSTDFYYNANNVTFNGIMKIQDEYNLSKSLVSDGVYETEIINKADFVNLYEIEVK